MGSTRDLETTGPGKWLDVGHKSRPPGPAFLLSRRLGRSVLASPGGLAAGAFEKGLSMLNELEKRTEAFDGNNSVAVTFADGQQWFLPKPYIKI
jgi:hypothetical protein